MRWLNERVRMNPFFPTEEKSKIFSKPRKAATIAFFSEQADWPHQKQEIGWWLLLHLRFWTPIEMVLMKSEIFS